MASLRDIRKRIKSVKSTRQITKAMKMVSAAKLRKAQDGIISARPYASTLDKMIAEVSARIAGSSVSHPLLTPRPVKKVEILLVTSDRGLAGGFNGNVTKRVNRFVRDNEGKLEKVFLTTIGRKGGDFFRGRGLPARKDWPGMIQKPTYAAASEIASELAARFLSGEVDQVWLCYNEFISTISQKVVFTQLLPFDASQATQGGSKTDYLYEPGPQGVLDSLVPQALNIKVFRAMLESVASEHAARMTAMENATKNAGEMIGKLTLYYNRTRQALITKELMEIVSGAEALK
ncbi:MAG: ATP synthase F1 subunit gamma [Myxococcaceae bacterium]